MSNFIQLGIHPQLNHVLEANGIMEPTPIQEQSIPVILDGHDLIAQAHTGTGKTLAFLLPILQKVNPHFSEVQALILSPTRELALQITAEVSKLITYQSGLRVLSVYGGQDVEQQMRKLQGGIQIVIATPGRLLDHIRRGTIQLSTISMLVLDEADQMLHLGFLPEVKEIMNQTASDRQTMMFSATMPQQIRQLAQQYMKQAIEILVEQEFMTVEEIEQIAFYTTDRAKQATLRALLDQYRPSLAMIFCRTKRRAKTLNEALQTYGYNTDELHGDLSQAKREEVMTSFRQRKIQYLVATDVAARGLDVEGVTHVFNYDIPHDVESYIHRIGRTGRAGEKGTAITLVAPKEQMFLTHIENGLQRSIPKKTFDLISHRNSQEKNNRTAESNQKRDRVRTSEVSTRNGEKKKIISDKNKRNNERSKRNSKKSNTNSKMNDKSREKNNKTREKNDKTRESYKSGKRKTTPRRRRSSGR